MSKVTATDAKTGETVEMRKAPHPRLVLFYSHEHGGAYGGLFREDLNAFVLPLFPVPSQTSVNWLCNQHGSPSLKIADLPGGVFKWEPGDSKIAVCDSRGNWTVNEWVEPPIRSEAIHCTECPPTIRAVALHVMGGCEKSLDYFLNWTAVAYQTNRPTGTAQLWSGVQGTAKGRVIQEVMKPLFGVDYVLEKRTAELAEQYNAFLERCTILNIDESEAPRRGSKADLEAKVKMYITGETLSSRDMRELQRMVPNYLNVIVTSNNAVATDLPEGDRRFSVSPRQMKKIETVFPDTNVMVAQMQAEIRRFAGFMAQYPIDISRARTALQNDAKVEMIRAAASGPTEFAVALRECDLQYFIDSFDDLSTRSAEVAGDFRAALAVWVEDSIHGRESAVRTSLLSDIYNIIFRPPVVMTPERTGKFLRKYGVFPKQMNSQQMRGRGVLVKWKAPADAVLTAEALAAKASESQHTAEEDWLNPSISTRSLNS